MREIYSKAHDYIASNQSIIDLIESETAQLEKDIIAMWVAGYVQRELEIHTGKEKTYGYKGYDLDRIARNSFSSVTMSLRWDVPRNIEDTLLNAYKEGYNTREKE